VAEIEQFRRRCLHAKAELHRLNDAFELRIIGTQAEMIAIHRLNEIELPALHAQRQMIALNVADRRLRHVLAIHADGRTAKDRGKLRDAYSLGLAVLKLMKPGRFMFSVPRPYATHEPMLGQGRRRSPVCSCSIDCA
jgi:hypothetical protein